MKIIFDIETDGLLNSVSKIHCLSYYELDVGKNNVKSLTDYNEIKKLLLSCELLVGHNIIQYDIPVLEKILDFKLPKDIKIIDTLGLSWYLYDDREKHGLEKWGEDLGVEKPKIEDWRNLSLQDYIHRCEEDVKINTLLYFKEDKYLNQLYSENFKLKNSIIAYLNFKLDCLRKQNGNKLFIDLNNLGNGLLNLQKMAGERVEELKKVMPKVQIFTTKTKPKVCYKKDGSLSSNGEKWFKLLEDERLPQDYEGEVKVFKEFEEPNPNSPEQIKDWLFMLGWEPLNYKTSITKNGENSVPQIYNDKKEVCKSVKKLYEIEPALENLDRLGMIKHRQGLFKSFKECLINNSYVHSQAKGFTSTLRLKHTKPFVNLPKPGLFYGDEVRGLISVKNDNYYLCGSDMKALEDTTKQHYMYYFDPQYVTEMRTPGFDPHLSIAEFGKLLTSEQVKRFKELKNKEDKTDEEKEEFSQLNSKRNIAKQLNFSCVYGAGPPKISSSIGIDVNFAKQLHTAYWERNKAVKQFSANVKIKVFYKDGTIKIHPSKELLSMSYQEQQEFNSIVDKMWVQNPVSKYWLSLRGLKDIFSAINQNTGVYCFDLYYKEVSKYFNIIFQYHDKNFVVDKPC